MGTYINYIIYTALMCYMAYWVVSVAKKRITYEIYEVCGLACFFSILFLSGWQPGPGILPLRVVGLILYIPAIFFVVSAFITLGRKGKPKDAWEQTTIVIDSWVFRIVRHPLYLGTTIWAVGVMLVFQSILSIVLGIATIFCCWMASKKEEQHNLHKFGEEYKKYLEKVPMWNSIKGVWNLRKGE
ncbi:MAG TPA: isoprenylcysteine carboxylmethyltransferase family protein [Dehalococcoidia bacterium]|nr:isoprenylcysteine carboxylmethyltransferase family protein [Dehalococcoidia bacterium]